MTRSLDTTPRLMPTLEYVVGDATQPQGPGPKVICHCCNDIGRWGSGFVVALSKRWEEPEKGYRTWFRKNPRPKLGDVLFVPVKYWTGEDLWVANLIGQHKTIREVDVPVRYRAISEGLEKVREFCLEREASVHMPRMGAGLAGGEWYRVEGLVYNELVNFGVSVTVYDLPK